MRVDFFFFFFPENLQYFPRSAKHNHVADVKRRHFFIVTNQSVVFFTITRKDLLDLDGVGVFLFC